MMQPSLLLVSLLLMSATLVATGRGDGDPLLGVDDEGNLHINTTSRETAVFVNGRNLQQEIETLRELVSTQASVNLELEGTVSLLASQQQRLLSSLGVCANVSFSAENIITASAASASSVFAADLDGDGDLDVLSASSFDNKIAWYENEDGFGTLSSQKIITMSANGARSVIAADLNGDGWSDVLSASYDDNVIAWHRNLDGKGTFSQKNVVTTNATGAYSVFAADLDGDGDLDVLSASATDNKVAWYENLYGNGTFLTQRIISTNALNALAVFAADVDGDGDVDVLSASSVDRKIAWYENMDGKGTFSSQKPITTSLEGAHSVRAADLDGDGDMDVLSVSYHGGGLVVWYENLDGMGIFSEQKVISSNTKLAASAFAADLDGDGDMDVVSASRGDDKVAWYENLDGSGTFSPQRVITSAADGAFSVFAADLDGDGDADVLCASENDGKITWFENICD